MLPDALSKSVTENRRYIIIIIIIIIIIFLSHHIYIRCSSYVGHVIKIVERLPINTWKCCCSTSLRVQRKNVSVKSYKMRIKSNEFPRCDCDDT